LIEKVFGIDFFESLQRLLETLPVGVPQRPFHELADAIADCRIKSNDAYRDRLWSAIQEADVDGLITGVLGRRLKVELARLIGRNPKTV
jgi:hypothetical protein